MLAGPKKRYFLFSNASSYSLWIQECYLDVSNIHQNWSRNGVPPNYQSKFDVMENLRSLSAKKRGNKSRKRSFILVSVTGVCPALSLMNIIFGDLKTTVVVRDLRNVWVNSEVEERIAHTLNYFRQLCSVQGTAKESHHIVIPGPSLSLLSLCLKKLEMTVTELSGLPNFWLLGATSLYLNVFLWVSYRLLYYAWSHWYAGYT